jgi:transketolase
MAEMQATRAEYGKALVELGRRNPKVVALDADLSGSTKTALFAKEFPERFFNMGVAEQNLMATAAGLSLAGFIPFASTFAIFAAGRAWEVVRQAIAYNAANVKIVATHGGITLGPDGGSHQAIEDLALMRCLPNMVVIVPADGVEMRQVVDTVAAMQGPCYVRAGRIKFPVIYDGSHRFAVGKGHRLREGSDVTLAACGLMVHHALEAAESLAGRGVSAEVLNLSTIKPLDEELLVASARKTGCVVACEEHLTAGGLAGAVAEVLGERFPAPLERIGVRDTFGLSGTPQELLEYFGLTPADIAEAAQRALGRKPGG